MTVQAPGFDLLSEVQERVVAASGLTWMSHAVLDYPTRSPLAEEANTSW
jgi:hypothetical protein